MRNEKILVVEFEENSLNSLLETLQTEGFQVVTAKDGHEGLLMFESENPDLVILEPMLLKLHGFDLCRKISNDTRKKTPVIITTGFYKGEHYKVEAIETFGASAFFEKPYKDEELMRAVHKLLGNGTSESVVDEKKSLKEEKAPSFDIEETVKEMERSIKEQKSTIDQKRRKSADTASNREKSGINTQIDEMLQDAFGDFGLKLEKKASKKGVEEKPGPEPEQEPFPSEEKTEDAKEALEEEEPVESPVEENKELKTEELIEELIQKEEGTEEELEPEPEAEEKREVKVQEIEEEKREIQREVKEEPAEEDKKIFEEYFEEPEKTPVPKNIFSFLKKIRKSLPLMIASTALVVIVAAGATYLFLKPNKPQGMTNQMRTENVSNLKRSTNPPGEQEYSSSPVAGDENVQSEPSGDNTSVKTETSQPGNAESDNNVIGAVEEPASTSEFMATTTLSSQQREVMLPEGMPSPESREFEVIEVEETGEEQLDQSSVEISSPLLDETVKNIIQSEDSSQIIKVGDLVPIETVDVPPVPTKKVNPKYPPAAYQRGIEETVVFRALISEFGNVLDVAFMDTSRTAAAFRKACDEAIRKWRFSPAKKGGVNVKVWKTFSIAFKKNKTE